MSDIYNIGYGYSFQSHENLDRFLRGEKLLEDTSSFYATYVSRMVFPEEHKKTLEKLNLIMRIAKTSIENGGFLSFEEEKKGLQHLRDISQELLDGAPYAEIAEKLEHMHHILTSNNSKAQLTSLLTELEYRFYLNEAPVESSMKEKLLSIGNAILQKLTPELPDIHAKAIAQSLSKVLKEKKLDHSKAISILEKMHSEWL